MLQGTLNQDIPKYFQERFPVKREESQLREIPEVNEVLKKARVIPLEFNVDLVKLRN